MRFETHKRGRRGVMLTEILVSIALLAVLGTLAASVTMNYYSVRERYVWQQAARWAAAAQLQRIHAGAVWDSAPPDGTVSEQILLETTSQPGRGPWDGYQLVTVVATVEMARGLPLREQVRGYVDRRDVP